MQNFNGLPIPLSSALRFTNLHIIFLNFRKWICNTCEGMRSLALESIINFIFYSVTKNAVRDFEDLKIYTIFKKPRLNNFRYTLQNVRQEYGSWILLEAEKSMRRKKIRVGGLWQVSDGSVQWHQMPTYWWKQRSMLLTILVLGLKYFRRYQVFPIISE